MGVNPSQGHTVLDDHSIPQIVDSVLQLLLLRVKANLLNISEQHCLSLREANTDQYDKNSSGDEIANVNFYAVRPQGTQIR